MVKWVKQPVVIWCDDFGGAGSFSNPAEDCGWGMFQVENGINKLFQLLHRYPDVVVTIFTVPNWSREHLLFGKKVSWDNVQKINNNRRGFQNWLRNLDKFDFFDFQLHGYRHKIVKWRSFFSFHNRAKQEFEDISDYKDALKISIKASNMFFSVFRRKPSGNRFPGWKPGKFGYKAMKEAGIKWFADYQSKDEITSNLDLINFPIGYRLSKINIDQIDRQLSSGKGLFITTHIEGATPTNSKLKNSIYYYCDKLSRIIKYIKEKYDVWWVGGETLSKYIYREISK